MRTLILATACALLLGGATACVRHHHHHYADAGTLERRHGDRSGVIVHHQPAGDRHCWRHRRHWHCRAH